MGDETVCPGCGRAFVQIGTHWYKSSECDYPEPSPEQKEILTGLLLADAGIEDVNFAESDEGRDTARLRCTSINGDLLYWIRDQFPALATDIRVKTTAQEASVALARITDGDSEEMDTSDLYQFRTRNLPAITRMRLDWYGEYEGGTATPPERVRLTPLMLKVLYALRGRLTTHQSPNPGVTFNINTVCGDAAFWLDHLSRFEPIVRRSTDTPMIFLQDSRAFFEYLRNDPVTQGDPLPGMAAKWPDSFEEVTTVSTEAERCPDCGRKSDALGIHWGLSECSPPALSSLQLGLVTGMFMVGGTTMVANVDYPILRFGTTDERFATWLLDTLGALGGSIHESSEQREMPSTANPVEVDFSDLQFVHSRPHPDFAQFRDWYDDGKKRIPASDVKQTPHILRGLVGLKGRVDEDGRPYIDIARQPVRAEEVEVLLDGFDPHIEAARGIQRAYIGDPDAFATYVGEPVPASDGRLEWLRERV